MIVVIDNLNLIQVNWKTVHEQALFYLLQYLSYIFVFLRFSTEYLFPQHVLIKSLLLYFM